MVLLLLEHALVVVLVARAVRGEWEVIALMETVVVELVVLYRVHISPNRKPISVMFSVVPPVRLHLLRRTVRSDTENTIPVKPLGTRLLINDVLDT